MKRAHLIVGIVTLLAFTGTGQAMRLVYGVPQSEPLLRALYRSSHLYIFWAGVLNLLLGCYWQDLAPGWRRVTQHAGSALILVAAPVLLAAFFVEPGHGNVDRPVTSTTLLLLLPAALAHLVATVAPARR